MAIGRLELAAILGVSSAGAFVAANQAGLATLGTIGLYGAIAETLSSWATKIYDLFQTGDAQAKLRDFGAFRSEEHTSELQSLMRISYAVFCLKKKNNKRRTQS